MATEMSTESSGGRSLLVDAVLGAVVSVVLGFLPFSPAIGGAVAGYLHRTDGIKVGALSGVIASIPVFLLFMLAMSFLTLGGVLGGLPGAGLAFAGIIVVFIFVFWLVIAAALGAVGGLIGEAIASDN